MKQFILALMTVLALASTATGKVRKEVTRDSQGNKLMEVEIRDTMIDGKLVSDTISMTTYHNSVSDEARAAYSQPQSDGSSLFKVSTPPLNGELMKAIIIVAIVFTLPVILIFIIFYFRYQNRKARYRLAEQALEKGQPLPNEFQPQPETQYQLNKGIKNIFLGVGLFIFLWAITTEFSLGCIGLLIMSTGIGQVVIYYANQPGNPKNNRNNYPREQ